MEGLEESTTMAVSAAPVIKHQREVTGQEIKEAMIKHLNSRKLTRCCRTLRNLIRLQSGDSFDT